MRYIIFLLISAIIHTLNAQISQFPYLEHFDSTAVPELPPQWETTFYRSAAGDFVTVQSSALSESTAVISTNAKIWQCLYSPLIDFSQTKVESLSFYERRSASHNSDIFVDASLDGGLSYTINVSDTLRNPLTASYIYRNFGIPDILSGKNSVRFRWRVAGNGTGSSGTVRFDDICFSALHSADAAVCGMETEPPFPVTGDDIRIMACIENKGLTPLTGIRCGIYNDADENGIPEFSERLNEENTMQTIQTGEAAIIECRLYDASPDLHRIIITCHHPDDANASNDTGKFSIEIGYPSMSLVVNEIMYDPLGGSAEYIELFNPGGEQINIAGWKLSDEKKQELRSAKFIISGAARYMNGGDHIVVANDSSVYDRFPGLRNTAATVFIRSDIFTLGNDGDHIILSDQYGRCIDSVHYEPAWHNPYIENCTGRSLERVNPRHASNNRSNWGTCADPRGGTPALINSLFTKSSSGNCSLSALPNPFSPDGDGYEDLTIIQYILADDVTLIRLRIFDSHGRLVRTLADGEPGGSHGERIWDGYNEQRRRVSIGLYVILLEALGQNGTAVVSRKSVIAVGAKI